MHSQKVQEVLVFLERSKGLETQKRYGVSLKGKQNTVAEHSWRLALMAIVIAAECKVEVDMSRVLSLALIHDLAEATTGDIDAYTQIQGGQKVIEHKAAQEDIAMKEMTAGLSFGPSVYALWQEYEAQETLESKFVRALDKLEGILHIAESGVEEYAPKEFHANYADKAIAAFDEASDHAPKLKDFLDVIKKDLRARFDHAGVAWIDMD